MLVMSVLGVRDKNRHMTWLDSVSHLESIKLVRESVPKARETVPEEGLLTFDLHTNLNKLQICKHTQYMITYVHKHIYSQVDTEINEKILDLFHV